MKSNCYFCSDYFLFYLYYRNKHTQMKHTIILMLALLTGANIAMAQMGTDNSYLRENYRNSKTAKKAEAKKAATQARKQERAKQTYYVKAKDGSITTKDKAAETNTALTAPYLAGAVPTTTEGIVCFERTIPLGSKTSAEALSILKNEAQEIIDSPASAKEISRIIQESTDTVIATICEPIYFKKAKWETDSALVRYQYMATVNQQAATVRIWLISYSYEEIGFGYKAEEWITDKAALTKDKLALRKANGKFRIKTVDYANALFARIEELLK